MAAGLGGLALIIWALDDFRFSGLMEALVAVPRWFLVL